MWKGLLFLVLSVTSAAASERCEYDLSPEANGTLAQLYAFGHMFPNAKFDAAKGAITYEPADPSVGSTIQANAVAFSKDPSDANRAAAVQVITVFSDYLRTDESGALAQVIAVYDSLRAYIATCTK